MFILPCLIYCATRQKSNLAKENRDIATIMVASDMAVKLSAEIRLSKRHDREMNMYLEQFLMQAFFKRRRLSGQKRRIREGAFES